MVTEKDYIRISGCSPWFNLRHFEYDEVHEFLTKLGYKIFVHPCIMKTQMTRSVPGTGEVERIGDPVNMEREFVVAVKEEQTLPYNVNGLDYPFHLSDVFDHELKKKLLL